MLLWQPSQVVALFLVAFLAVAFFLAMVGATSESGYRSCRASVRKLRGRHWTRRRILPVVMVERPKLLHSLAASGGIPGQWRRAGLDHRRLSGLRSNDAEQRSTGASASCRGPRSRPWRILFSNTISPNTTDVFESSRLKRPTCIVPSRTRRWLMAGSSILLPIRLKPLVV